jgi:predicted AlkP superfamily pyrophosphatase or phosphodiesterase
VTKTFRRGASVAVCVCTLSSLIGYAQSLDRRPKLIVVLMVDQMRGDYADKFRGQWTGGLQRLLTSGAWFRQADYPYFDTVTCAGHATVGTGALPWTHGMVMNSWWDRARNVEVPCTEDRSATPVSYGKVVTSPGDSAAPLRVSTLADELRVQLSPAARVVGFSLKARGAIPLAGHRPDAVAWFDDSGAFVTSTAFTKTPIHAVADFIQRHPVEDDLTKVWEQTLPASAYLYENPAIGAHVPPGMSASFPHRLSGSTAAPDKGFYDRWQASPFSDEYLAEMAVDVTRALQLGQTGSTDMVAVSFSALDKVGHDYGPESPEIQDVLVRLDRTIGTLLEALDRQIGKDNYVVALSADHGVAPLPERLTSRGIDAGRIDPRAIEQIAQAALQKELGSGKYVSQILNGDIYLAPGVLDRLKARPAATEALRRALRSVPGIQDVLTSDRVVSGGFDEDGFARRLARSYDPDRSGDVFVIPRPYWTIRTNGTGHGSSYGYDTRVPILLMGKDIAPGEYFTPASPADIAPTLALLAGVTLPQAEGRALTEAFRRAAENPTPTQRYSARVR